MDDLRQRVEKELLSNILPFWLKHSIDDQYGGFCGQISNDLTIEGVDAARKLFAKSKEDGAEVQKSMEALVAELNSIAAALTPANLPPAAASGSQ